MRRHAEAEGREVSFGIRLHVIVRDTTAEAWAAADRLIRKLDDHTIAEAQKVFARMDSVGQARMTALHGGRRDKLEINPNLWAGVGLVRGGAGTALARRWWAMPIPWRNGLTNIAASRSIALSSQAIRIWKKPIALANWCCRNCHLRIRFRAAICW